MCLQARVRSEMVETALATLSAELQARRSLPPPESRRALRKAAGATLHQVARACGVSHAAVWEWEHGACPRGDHLNAYVEVLRLFREGA